MTEKRLVLLRKPLPPIPSSEPKLLISHHNKSTASGSGKRPPLMSPPPTQKTEYLGDIAVSKTSVVKPRKPRGPDPLHTRLSSRPAHTNLTLELVLSREQPSTRPPPEFTLNDFQNAAVKAHRVWSRCGGQERPTKAFISRENYKKMTGWFATHVPKQTRVNVQTLIGDTPEKVPRKPRHQILLEMKAMLSDAIKDVLSQSDDDSSVESRLIPVYPTSGSVFKTSTSRYFLGQGRSTSPFDAKFDPIGLAEAAVLDCMLSGGTDLMLKAHFLQTLPDLESLKSTLVELNLSFNELPRFPVEVLVLSDLKSLKLRNNPIAVIPENISILQSLQTLCISFNLLSALPAGLYDLKSLTDLDLSYNRLSFLSSEIKKLSSLKCLNVEGNQLAGLPCGMLDLSNIQQLHVENNFMHPFFWAENIINQPQRLTDLSSLCIVKNELNQLYGPNMPSDIKHILNHVSVCDCCGGARFGEGLRTIWSPKEPKFGIRNLPFIFSTCSTKCKKKFSKKDFIP